MNVSEFIWYTRTIKQACCLHGKYYAVAVFLSPFGTGADTHKRALVVDATSASPQLPGITYYGIEATHSGMCKFESANAPGFHTISTAIRDWISEAPQTVKFRWVSEKHARWSKEHAEIDERRMPFVRPFICRWLFGRRVA